MIEEMNARQLGPHSQRSHIHSCERFAASTACMIRSRKSMDVGSGGDEVADRRRDLLDMRFQREMAGVEEADERAGNVAPEGFGAGRQEERIVLAPDGQEGWLVRSEVILEGRVQRDVALIVAEQVQLHFVRAGSRQIEYVERITVRRNESRVGYAVGVLPARRLRAQERAERLACWLCDGTSQ